MLSPEVWQFRPPKSGAVVRNRLSEKNIVEEVSDKLYHSIFILCANTHCDIPKEVEDFFNDSSYYKLNECILAEFLEPNFVEAFIKQGSLSCVSIGTDAEVDNSVAFTPEGNLLIVLNTLSYQELGIEGKKYTKSSGKTIYYIEINIQADNFKPSKKNYEHIKKRLKTFSPFTLIVRWEPNNETVCPSSIAKYFSERGVNVEVCSPKLKSIRQHAARIPVPSLDGIHELIEWMGMRAIGGDTEPEDDYLSSYSTIEFTHGAGFITAYHICGLFSPKFILQLRLLLRNVSDSKVCSWIGLTAQCFSDAPRIKALKLKKCNIPEDYLLTFVYNDSEEIFYQCYNVY